VAEHGEKFVLAPVGLAEPFFRPLALGDVPGQGNSKPPPVLPKRTESDLDRENGTVLPAVMAVKGKPD
jgi:hypothetical protein